MRAISLYACQGEAIEELSFGAGEVINKVTQHLEPGWFSGELKGKRGIFPGNYVRFEEDPQTLPLETANLVLEQQPNYISANYPPLKTTNAIDVRQKLADKSASLINDARIKSLDRPVSMVKQPYGSDSTGSSIDSVGKTYSSVEPSDSKPTVPKRPPQKTNSGSLEASIFRSTLPGNFQNLPLTTEPAKPVKKLPPPPPPSIAASPHKSFPLLSELAIGNELTRSSTSSISGNIQAIAQQYERTAPISTVKKAPPPAPPKSVHSKFSSETSTLPPPIPSSRPSGYTLQSLAGKPPPPSRPDDFRIAMTRYRNLFTEYDKWATGILSASIIKSIWTRSQLEPIILGQIWNMMQVSKSNGNGIDRNAFGLDGLTAIDFCCGMYVIDELLRGREMPVSVDQLRNRASNYL